MQLKRIITITLCLIGFFSFAQTDSGKKYHTKLIKVKGNIYMLQGQGGNIGIIHGKDGIFLIDDQFEEGIPDLLKDLKGLSKKPIKYLVNTHHHGDHVGGNALLAKEGVTIFSHKNVRDRIEEKMKDETEKTDRDILPQITLSDDLTFHFNGEIISVFHVQDAHTDGDVMVYFMNSNVLHTGDIFFNGKYPFIDLESGGSLAGVIEALDKILMIADGDTKIIPGHGNLGTITDVMYTKAMLINIMKRVTHYVINLKSEEEILQMKEITQKYDDKGYGDGFISTEKIIRTVYKEVGERRNNRNK